MHRLKTYAQNWTHIKNIKGWRRIQEERHQTKIKTKKESYIMKKTKHIYQRLSASKIISDLQKYLGGLK
jgi:enterochelin esterase-like enzyme